MMNNVHVIKKTLKITIYEITLIDFWPVYKVLIILLYVENVYLFLLL